LREKKGRRRGREGEGVPLYEIFEVTHQRTHAGHDGTLFLFFRDFVAWVARRIWWFCGRDCYGMKINWGRKLLF